MGVPHCQCCTDFNNRWKLTWLYSIWSFLLKNWNYFAFQKLKNVRPIDKLDDMAMTKCLTYFPILSLFFPNVFRLKLPCAQCLAVSVKLSIVIISIHYPPTFVLTCCHHLLEPWPKLAGLFSVATGARQLSRKWNLIATCSQCGSQRCTFVVLKSLIADSAFDNHSSPKDKNPSNTIL
jgi:hypothetical protein